MQLESLSNTHLCNANTIAFIEELLNLECLQDNINEVGNFLTQHIAKDYGFSVKLSIEGVNIKDEAYQKVLKDYRYIKNEKVKQKIQEYAQANKDENLKLILACLAMALKRSENE